MTDRKRAGLRPIVFPAILVLLPLAFAGIIFLTTLRLGHGDSGDYLRIAGNPFQFTTAPHGYRILIPYLARLISETARVSLEDAFLSLSLLAFVLMNAAIMIWAAADLRRTEATAILLAALFSFSHAGVDYLHNYVHVGLWWHLLVFLGFTAVLRNRFGFLAGLLFLGGFVTETVVLLIPLCFLADLFRRGFRNALARAAGLTAVFLIPFLLLRSGWLLRGTEGFASYSSFYSAEYVQFVYAYMGGVFGALRQIVGSFNVLWIPALLGFLHSGKTDRVMACLIPLAVLQLVLATDAARMTLIAFPAVLLLTANLFRVLTAPERTAASVLAIGTFYAYDWNWHRQVIAAAVAGLMLIWYFLVVRRRLGREPLAAGAAAAGADPPLAA